MKQIFLLGIILALIICIIDDATAQRRQLKWENISTDGTPGRLAGWDENGNPVSVDPDTLSSAGSSAVGAANELQKTDGAGNLDNTGLFSATDGSMSMGTGLAGGSRSITADGTDTNVGIYFIPKGTSGSAILYDNAQSNYWSTASAGVSGRSSAGFYLEGTSTNTNTVNRLFRMVHNTSGVPAAGIGTGFSLESETASGNNEIGAVIEAVTTDVTSTSEDFDLVFKTMSGGSAAAEKFRLKSFGGVGFSGNYTSTSLGHAINVDYVVNGGTSPTHATLAYGNSFTFGTNNQVYYGMFIYPTVTVGAFTGTKTIGIYYGASGTPSTDHYGLIIASGKTGLGTAGPTRQLHVAETDVSVNSVTYPQRLSHWITTGTEANGIGVGLEFEVHTSGDLTTGVKEIGATIETVATDVTAASEDFDLIFKTMAAGAAATEKMRITSDGRIVIPVIPTSCAGEDPGTIWSDAGTLKVCP